MGGPRTPAPRPTSQSRASQHWGRRRRECRSPLYAISEGRTSVPVTVEGVPRGPSTRACGPLSPGTERVEPIRSVARIVEDESRSHDVWVVTRDHDLGSPERYEIATATWVPIHGAQVLYVDLGSLRGMAGALRHIRRVRPDLVYVNSLWSPFFALLPIVACRTVAPRPPVLLAPRGSCGPEALEIKVRKKALVGVPLRQWLRSSRLIWHTTSAEETSDVAQWLGRPPRRIVTRADPGTPPASEASPPVDGSLRLWVSSHRPCQGCKSIPADSGWANGRGGCSLLRTGRGREVHGVLWSNS